LTPASASSPFTPHPLCRGGHRQTLLGYFARRNLRWTAPAEDMVVDATPEVRLLLRATWQPDRTAHPTVVVVHGLGGSDRAGYAIATGLHAYRRGWNVVRMNMRGAGDSEYICPRLYNAGLDADLLAVLSAVAEVTPRLAVVGFSLGANLTLLAAARNAAHLPASLVAVAGVSPPLDLAACADALGHPDNWFYEDWFMRELRAAYRRRQQLLPHLYEPGREAATRSVRDYDEAITAVYGGYRDAADYYDRSSAGPLLTRIRHPTLILAAADDPLIPIRTVTTWALPESGLVEREVQPTGGHVGFVARCAAPGRFWAGERVIGWLEARWREG
jgi:predicted alpha/beta-fold hydrolase